jgi:hypothetical protein
MKKDEYQNTSNLLKSLLSVPHSEIKEKLEEEKSAKKKQKRKKVNRNDH